MDKRVLIVAGIVVLIGAVFFIINTGNGEEERIDVGLIHTELEEMPTNVREYLEQYTMTENYRAFTFDGDTYLYATRGEMMTAGYSVVLKDGQFSDGNVEVIVEKRDPDESDMVAQVLTYPIKLVRLADNQLEYTSVTFKGEDQDTLAEVEITEITRMPETIADLYFGTEDGLFTKERRVFDADITAENAYLLIEALIEGPQDNEQRLRVLPEGTTILNYDYDQEEGLATVDLGGTITDVAGSMGEIFAVYGIVNTLSEVEGIERVQILINGEEVESLAGHIYLLEPLEPDYSYLEDNMYK